MNKGNSIFKQKAFCFVYHFSCYFFFKIFNLHLCKYNNIFISVHIKYFGDFTNAISLFCEGGTGVVKYSLKYVCRYIIILICSYNPCGTQDPETPSLLATLRPALPPPAQNQTSSPPPTRTPYFSQYTNSIFRNHSYYPSLVFGPSCSLCPIL